MADEVLMEVQLLQTKQKVGRKALNKHDESKDVPNDDTAAKDPMASSADAVALDDKEDILSNHGVASNTATITAKTDVVAFAEANSSVASAQPDGCAESLLHAGWGCYDDVMWAKNTGIYQHPEWYRYSGYRLTPEDPISMFHSFMFVLSVNRPCRDTPEPPCANHECAYPCYPRPSSTCGFAEPGTDCADQLRWAMTEGIHNHPEWYTGLTAHSSVSDFQRYLSHLPSCRSSDPPCYGANDRCPPLCETTTTTTESYGWNTDSYGWNTGSYGW